MIQNAVLPFFPRPYPNELLYGTIARYHSRTKNPTYDDTAEDVLGSRKASVTALFPNNIAFLCSRLQPGSLLTPERLIHQHTMLPLYRPFLPTARAESALEYLKASTVGDPENHLKGLLRYSLTSNRSFKYCPECFAADSKEYGEAYWHRDHQHFGVLTCYKHKVMLIDTGLPLAGQKKRVLYALSKEYQPGVPATHFSAREMGHLKFISDEVHWLLNETTPEDPIGVLHRSYRRLLIERGFANASSIMSHTEISKAFTKYYGAGFLEALSSRLPEVTDKNWLVRLLKRGDTVTDPIRHILVMRFLQQDSSQIFSTERSTRKPPTPKQKTKTGPELNRENSLCCRFCNFTALKTCWVKGGKFLDTNAATDRLREHVKEAHPEEYATIQQALGPSY